MNMRRSFVTLAALTLVAWTLLAQQDAAPILAGFSGDTARAERKREEKFGSAISTDNIGDYAKLLSARPHHVGSPYDKKAEEWLASKFNEWGWDVRVDSSQIRFPTRKVRVTLSRRSAHSGNRSDGGCQAPETGRCEGLHEDSGTAHFLRRCAAASCGVSRTRRAARLARRARDHLSRRARAGESSPEGEIRLGHEADQ